MPELNDTTGQRITHYVVQVDAKAEGFERINLPRGPVDIPEGGFMVPDAQGRASLPNAGTVAAGPLVDARSVYINFSNPNAPQTSDRAVANDAGGTRYAVQLSAGGFAGLLGSGLRITMPFTDEYFLTGDLGSIAQGEPLTLKRELDAATVRPSVVKFGRPTGSALSSGMPTLLAAPTNSESDLRFAVVEEILTGVNKIRFVFTSNGSK